MRQKAFVFVILTILLACSVLAQEDDLFIYHALGLEVLISNEFDVLPSAQDYFVDYVSAQLTWYPQEDYRQKVESITTEPQAGFDDNTGFLFEWNKPSQLRFAVWEKSELTAKNEFVRVTNKIFFPIRDLDYEYARYLEPQEIIDINNDIRQAASEIVLGEDDLYTAVFKIAEWVENNVEYNLSTTTAEATQKASWVMDNRKGVCDEITSLFISMCRSLGMPARFVTGISYSNINLQNDGWGPHGWAEVYFPGVGWVPFDVTYKELGFVDATHIKLKTTLDAKETSINYETKSRNTEIQPRPLEFEVKVRSKDYLTEPRVNLKVKMAQLETGFDSYNLVILTVTNPNSQYLTTRVSLANVNDLEIIDNNFKPVMLKPKEAKTVYWLLKVKPDLKSGYIYTFPIKITGSSNEEAETSFRAAEQFEVYSQEDMKVFMTTEESEQKPYSSQVLVSCFMDKSKIYYNETVNISCKLENRGDQVLKAIIACLDKECAIKNKVLAKETERFDYARIFDTLGVKTLVFKVENELIKKVYYQTVEVQDIPLLKIENVSFKGTLDYDESTNLRFFLRKKSTTYPKNVTISLEHPLLSQEWSIPTMDHDYEFMVILKGSDQKIGRNDFNITASYTDDKGTAYKLVEKETIVLVNVNLLQRVVLWLRMLEHSIEEFINKI